MKVASKKPATIQSPVYITSDVYEIWYAEPVSLGRILKKSGYWYTQDGMRFVSSRDAMRYLISKRNPLPVIIPERRRETSTPPHTERRTQTVQPKQIVNTTNRVQKVTSGQDFSKMNQNHPRFQEFLDFLDYKARKEAARAGQ